MPADSSAEELATETHLGPDARCDGGKTTVETEDSEFPFEIGDLVRVRVRENGTSGNIIAKFDAEVEDIRTDGPVSTPTARFDLPWGLLNSVTLRSYEAEFEVIDR